MLFIKENFLSSSSFKALNDSVKNFYGVSKEEFIEKQNNTFIKINEQRGIYKPFASVQRAKRVRCWSNSPDTEIESLEFFGEVYREPLKQLRDFYTQLGFTNIKLHNAWLQYGDRDTEMHRHSDGAIRGSHITQCFTSLLFCHEYWEDDWGGIFHVESEGLSSPISPEPNKFVTWTRDHPHWMTPITADCPLRMFLGTSWYQL